MSGAWQRKRGWSTGSPRGCLPSSLRARRVTNHSLWQRTRTHALKHTHTHTRTHTNTHTYASTHAHTAHPHAHTHTRVHTRTTRPWTRMPIADKRAHGRHTRRQASPTIARARRQAYPIPSYQSPITVKWFAPGWVSLTHDTRARRGSTSILFSHGPYGQACIVSWVRLTYKLTYWPVSLGATMKFKM